jgi:predicted short-subunit dehydrogenase-like oxidoreductase (DUF2520 family)
MGRIFTINRIFMKLVLIGSGNVAWNLGKLFQLRGHEVVQIIGSNSATASDLAYELDTESTNYWSVINRQADMYLITVGDDRLPLVIAELTNHLGKIKKPVVHTSAAASLDILEPVSERRGILYPLQSLVRGSRHLPEIPFMVEGNDAETTEELFNLARQLSGKAQVADAGQRLNMHLAAVLVNNFTNHLYVLAADWCRKKGLAFEHLQPLIEETARRLQEGAPAKWQTGPAKRKDKGTVEKHRALLGDEPALLELYDLFTKRIATT